MRWTTRTITAEGGALLHASSLELSYDLIISVHQLECCERGGAKMRWYMTCLGLGMDYMDLSEGINLEQAQAEALAKVYRRLARHRKALLGYRRTAARRLTGAMTRRATITRNLFDAARLVRARVAQRYRGRHAAALRRAFGAGIGASAVKVALVFQLADKVLEGCAAHPRQAAEAGVGVRQIAKVQRLRSELLSLMGQVERRQVEARSV